MQHPWPWPSLRTCTSILCFALLVPLHVALMGISACEQDADEDGYDTSTDCDDSNPDVHPDAPELCDTLDNDCDTEVDEGLSENVEACDGIDNDCNGQVDDGLPVEPYFQDQDGDGYGDPAVQAEGCIPGYVTDGTDCNDTDASWYPGADDWLGDTADSNCDGGVDVIDTAAGGGRYGDGGPATVAWFSIAAGVVSDGAGNLYVPDTDHHVVRRVDALTGVITTVAGNGTAGSSGDGGPASLAQLNAPVDVLIDLTGNLLIADRQANRVRRVSTSGIITTVAGTGTAGFSGDGGPATAAQLNNPSNLSSDGRGGYLITDKGNHRIRRVSATGTISTVVGNGTAGFAGDGGLATAASLDSPGGTWVDLALNIFVADTGNHRVRRVAVTTGNIGTWAGNGTAGYSGDGGQATAASLNRPVSVLVDSSFNFYIVENSNHTLRKVVPTGIISTLAGNGTAGFAGDGVPASTGLFFGPTGLTRDEAGNFYLADTGNGRIRKIDTAGILDTVAGAGGSEYTGDGGAADNALIEAYDVAVDSFGDVYIASLDRVRRVASDTGVIETFAGTGTEGYGGDGAVATEAQVSARGIAVDDSGVYIADTANNRVRWIDASSGLIWTIAGTGTAGYSGDDGQATDAQLNQPTGVAVDSAGNLYIADTNNHRVRKVDAAGVITTVAGSSRSGYSGDGAPATLARLTQPNGVRPDGKGNLYIADTGNNRVRKVTANGIISSVAGNGLDGYAGDGGPATSAQLRPSRLAFDGRGNLIIADPFNGRVRMVDLATGVITTIAGNGATDATGDGGAATAASIGLPYGVDVDLDGNLYLADYNNDRVRVVMP